MVTFALACTDPFAVQSQLPLCVCVAYTQSFVCTCSRFMSLHSWFRKHMQVVGLTQLCSLFCWQATNDYSVNGFVYSSAIFIYSVGICFHSMGILSFFTWQLQQIFSASQLVFNLLLESKFPHPVVVCHLSTDNDGCPMSNSSRKIGATGVALPFLATHLACIIILISM